MEDPPLQHGTPLGARDDTAHELQSDVFRHWQSKRALDSDEALRQCQAQAKECREQMQYSLAITDEQFPCVILEPGSPR